MVCPAVQCKLRPPLLDRPLSFPALRSIVVCFLEAIPLLLSVVGMLCFFLFIFGVTGTELFAGDYHKVGGMANWVVRRKLFLRGCFRGGRGTARAHLPSQRGAAKGWPEGRSVRLRDCSLQNAGSQCAQACVDAAGNIEQSESYMGEYGCGARDCPEGYTCTVGWRGRCWVGVEGEFRPAAGHSGRGRHYGLRLNAPCVAQNCACNRPQAPISFQQEFASALNVNVAGFDNVAAAFLTVFQCMTLSGWSYIMYRWGGAAGRTRYGLATGLAPLLLLNATTATGPPPQGHGRRGRLQRDLLCAAGGVWGLLCGERLPPRPGLAACRLQEISSKQDNVQQPHGVPTTPARHVIKCAPPSPQPAQPVPGRAQDQVCQGAGSVQRQVRGMRMCAVCSTLGTCRALDFASLDLHCHHAAWSHQLTAETMQAQAEDAQGTAHLPVQGLQLGP
jgi:hypothetical protein